MNDENNIDEDDSDLSVREMYQLIAEESTHFQTDVYGNATERADEGFIVFTDALIQIEEFVTMLLDSDDLAFIVTERDISKNGVTGKREKVYELPLAQYFRLVIELFQQYSPHFEYSINGTLFFKSCFALELGNEWFKEPLAATSKVGKRAFELFNDLITTIRVDGRKSAFRCELHQRTYNAKRNYQSALKFVRELFKRRLMVLRVDFAYQTKYASAITAEKVQDDLAHFLYNFRRNQFLSAHLEGYIWKIEYGYQKGFHVHCLFFYDGSKVQNDAYWANQIGMYWMEIITKGKGMFYNGNTKENKAKYEKLGLLGIGMIGRIHDDPEPDPDKEKRDILFYRILAYLLKAEQFLIVKQANSPNGRMFGKGHG